MFQQTKFPPDPAGLQEALLQQRKSLVFSQNTFPCIERSEPPARRTHHQPESLLCAEQQTQHKVGRQLHPLLRPQKAPQLPASSWKATSLEPRRGPGPGTVRLFPAANTSPLPKPQRLSIKTCTTALKLQNHSVFPGDRRGRLSVPWLQGRTATQSQIK